MISLLTVLVATQAPPLPAVPTEGVCQTVDNTYRCAQAVEGTQLPLSAGRARRSERVLELLLSNGSWQAVPNDSFDYSYLGFVRRPDFFVLHAQGDEWTVVRLVSARTGWSTVVDEIPVPSPDGRHLVTASYALEAAFSPNRVAVLRVAGDTLVEEWGFEPDDWGPASPRWITDSSFVVARMKVLREEQFRIAAVDTVLWRRTLTGWMLAPRR